MSTDRKQCTAIDGMQRHARWPQGEGGLVNVGFRLKINKRRAVTRAPRCHRKKKSISRIRLRPSTKNGDGRVYDRGRRRWYRRTGPAITLAAADARRSLKASRFSLSLPFFLSVLHTTHIHTRAHTYVYVLSSSSRRGKRFFRGSHSRRVDSRSSERRP